MGNDGGSIPKRIELVKEKQKEVRPDQNVLKVAMWFFCALSKRPLQVPVVACALGKLYNKDAVLEYLINKSAYGDGDVICSHITSIKDVKTLNLTPNPAFKESSASVAHFEQGMVSRFICPISMKEMNGKLKFVYLDTCGCVFSEQTLKEVPSEVCIQCGKAFKQENIVTINPDPAEQEKLKASLAEKRAKAKDKKEKKKNKAEQEKAILKESNEKIGSSSASNNKRKNDDGHDDNSQPSKKFATDSQVIGSSSLVPPKAKQSKAIQSIYSKKKDCEVTESYLVRGTFNRYAA